MHNSRQQATSCPCRYIKQGVKTVEGRLNSGLMRQIGQHDTIDFYGGRGAREEVRVQVMKVVPYSSFHDMLTAVGVEAVLPEYRDVGSAVKLFQSFPGYYHKEQMHGVLAIHIMQV